MQALIFVPQDKTVAGIPPEDSDSAAIMFLFFE